MKALTLWQPWSSLVMSGLKVYEFRTWPAPRALRGHRIINHAGRRKMMRSELQELIYNLAQGNDTTLGSGRTREALAFVKSVDHMLGNFPYGVALGSFVLGEPKRATDIMIDLGRDPATADPNIWGWPITDLEVFPEPIPCKGAQGFWDYRP